MIKTVTTLPNEPELFAQMAQGDEAAFTQIFYHYTQRIFQYILNKTKSKEVAEEIVQEIFMKLWNKRSDLPEIKNYQSYIFTMAANKTFDWLKGMAREESARKRVWQIIGDRSNITTESLDLKNSQELINQAVEQLSPQRKKVYLLSRQDGLTHEEIASELKLSEKTVNNHLTEALHFIREYLQNNSAASVASIILLFQIHP